MKLSIIIVSYNVKHYLAQCLTSIWRSDEKDVEGFKTFTQRYLNAVDIERLSVEKFAE